MNVTEIARLMNTSRTTAYKIINSVGFPKPIQLQPPRWDEKAVRAWHAANSADGVQVLGRPVGSVVGGVLVRS